MVIYRKTWTEGLRVEYKKLHRFHFPWVTANACETFSSKDPREGFFQVSVLLWSVDFLASNLDSCASNFQVFQGLRRLIYHRIRQESPNIPTTGCLGLWRRLFPFVQCLFQCRTACFLPGRSIRFRPRDFDEVLLWVAFSSSYRTPQLLSET